MYEELCSSDYLEVEEKHEKSNEFIYEKFKKQLGRGPRVTTKQI